MDRLAIIVVALIAFIILHLRNFKSKTQEEKCEGVIAFYIFTCCFSRLYLPLITYDAEQQYGSLGNSITIWPYFLFSIYLLWHIKIKKGGFTSKPNKIVIGVFLAYTAFTMLNPYNSVVGSSVIAIFFLGTLLIFYYLLANAFSGNTIVRGIYKGVAFTICLQAILCVLYPLLGMEFIIKVFDADAALRGGESEARLQTVGTFGHPNALGVYASYIFMFFLSCVLTKYKFRKSMALLAVSFIVTVFSGSRSALVSSLAGTVVLVIFYLFRRYSLLNPKIFVRGVLPLLIVGIVLAIGPLRQFFDNAENLDDMATARLMHYYCAGEIVQAHPFFGVGLNGHLYYLLNNTSLVDFEQLFDTTNMWQPEEFLFHNPVHNIWLILLAELGIIGFLPILGFVIYYFASFKKRIKRSSNIYYHIMACTGLGIMCTFLVQGNSDWNPLSQQPLIISMMFLCFSLSTRLMQEHSSVETDEPHHSKPNEDENTATTA